MHPAIANQDLVERTKERVENFSRERTGVSALHAATLLSIGLSIGLYLAGKKELAIFIGLWPPTFQALRSRD